MNGAAPAAVVGCRFDVLTGKKAGDLAMPVDGTVADLDNDAATDGDLVIGEAGGGLVSAVGDLEIVEPDKLEMAEPADDLGMVVLCDNS